MVGIQIPTVLALSGFPIVKLYLIVKCLVFEWCQNYIYELAEIQTFFRF